MSLADFEKSNLREKFWGTGFHYLRWIKSNIQGERFSGFNHHLNGRKQDLINQDLAIHAINSAIENTDMDLYFLYDGGDEKFIKKISEKGVNVIRTESSFKKKWENKDKAFKSIANGTFLRLEIPKICKKEDFDDEFILYTDIDVLFLKQPSLEEYKPEFFAASTQTDKDATIFEKKQEMNAAIMWINLKGMNDTYTSLSDEIFRATDICDYEQGFLRKYYMNKWDYLPESFNWKPKYGLPNKETSIIHFHGPKPHHMKKILKGENIPDGYASILSKEKNNKEIKYFINLYAKYDEKK